MPETAGKRRGVFVLRPAGPLHFDRTLERYRLWGLDPANVYRAGAFYRVAGANGAGIPFKLTASGPDSRAAVAVSFEGPDSPTRRAVVRGEAEQLLGLHADLPGFYEHARGDRVLAPLVAALAGLRPSIMPDPFEMLVGAIAAQQVNLAFAFATRARLVGRFGRPRTFDGVTVYRFPPPGAVASASVADLRAMQFSTRKAEYLVGLAREIADGRLDLAALAQAPDDEVVARLTGIRGLGRWTAEWFLARALGRPDVCPAEDLGVRRAAEALCFGGQPCDPARLRRRAARWRPYRSLAVHYLLAGLRSSRSARAPGGAA